MDVGTGQRNTLASSTVCGRVRTAVYRLRITAGESLLLRKRSTIVHATSDEEEGAVSQTGFQLLLHFCWKNKHRRVRSGKEEDESLMSRDLSFRKITMEELTLKKGRGCLCVTHVAPRCAAKDKEEALLLMMAGLVFRWMALKHSLLDFLMSSS